MSDLSTDLTPSEAPETSTQLDVGRPADPSQAKPPVEEEKRTIMSAIERAEADVDGKEEKAPEEKVEAKPEPEPKEPKEPVAEKPEEETKPEVKAEAKERRQPIDAPSRFLPRAKELWPNTPHEVRAEVQRAIQEADERVSQAQAVTQEYEAVKPYAEMAKKSGTTLDQALGRYVSMEQTLRSDPTSGFRGLLQNMNMSPTQAIGHIAAAFNVTPERLAEHMQREPNAYTALAPRQQAQQQQAPQVDPEVAALKQQVADMQSQQLVSQIITPFAAENPRYFELQDHIAQLLNSGMVPSNLALPDRLAAAYDMAVRLNPSAKSPAPPASDAPEESDSRAGSFGGTKSVRGAPASGMDTSKPRRGKVSRNEAFDYALSELGLN